MVANNEHPYRVVFVFVRLAPEHFSLVFAFVEMFACTVMAEGLLRLRRDRYSEYRLAVTCRQALDKCDQWALVAHGKSGSESRFGDSGRMPFTDLIGHTSVSSAVKSSLCWQTLAKRSDRISRVTLLTKLAIRPTNWAAV